MDRDDFIITVYCLVCDQYRALFSEHPLRHGGFTPQLTDEEVITLELCGEYFKLNTDQDLFDYFRQHYPTWFPQLRDRSLFVRQAANLWQAKAAIQQRLTLVSGQATDPVQIIDTLPLPVCVFTRSRRDRCFKPNADYGHCAAKNLTYYGFKLGLRVSRLGMITYFPLLPARRCFKPNADYGHCAAKDLKHYGFKLGLRISRVGMITHFPLLPARPHDIQLLDDLVENFVGVVPADKGFMDAFRQALLAEHSVALITPPRKRMTTTVPQLVLKVCGRIRKCVETVGSLLTDRFAVERIRVHDLWHFHHRLIRKVLAHTVGVFLNLQLGRQPLDLDGLLDV